MVTALESGEHGPDPRGVRTWEDVGPVIGLEELARLLLVGVRTVERMLADGTFPIAPLPLVAAGRQKRILRWSTGEVRAWVEGRRATAPRIGSRRK